jgi:diguanylate cyclase (GGDEF)-like protein/PAS domain S-box-containing protein
VTDRVDRTILAHANGEVDPTMLHSSAHLSGTRADGRWPAFSLPVTAALICDHGGVVRQANRAMAELLGLPEPEAVLGARVHRFVLGPDDNAALVWPGGGPVSRVRVVRVPLAPVELAEPDGTAGGSGAGGIGELTMVLLVDVTDLQHAMHALGEERRRMDEVERVAGIGSWEFDPRTGETVWSQGHYDLLGIERGSVLPGAGAVLDVTHPEDREKLAAYWEEHRTTGATIDIEYRVLLPSGEQRRLHGLAKAQRDAGGRLVRYTGSIRDITEQWRAETELARERARLLEAQRISRLGSWAVDLVTQERYFSEALLEMLRELGVDPQADPMAAVHPDDRGQLTDLLDQLSRGLTGTTVEVEFRGAPPAATVYVCRARAERNAAGDIVRVLGTVQEVTEQRAMERQLREERRRLADAQRVASIGTWEADPKTDRVYWSDMLRELFGVPPAEPVSYQTYLSVVHPEDRGWVDDAWRQLVRERQPMECEHRVIRRDGAQRVFRMYGAAVPTPDGGSTLVGTAQDVTEHRTAEARMRRSSQRFADLVSITPVGIGLFDPNERLVDANDALCQLLGYSLDRLRGMTVEALTHPDDRPGHLPPVTKVLASGQSSYTMPQVVLLRAGGEAVYCELHISVSVQDDGQQFWLVVFSDITERRRAAEALRHQATHDELTGLPNRAAVKQVLGDLLAGPTRSRVAVLFCDIDNFKRVNDSLGHDAGDELLVALARRLDAGMPEGCMPARLGGDEYLVICADTDLVGGVQALVTEVSKLLRTAVGLRGQPVRVSATIGAAVPNSMHTAPEDLLRFADAAMYQAKRAGRGQTALASVALMAAADRRCTSSRWWMPMAWC